MPPAVITGVEPAMAETNTFALYPNPASNKAYLVFRQPAYEDYTWTVYDMLGRETEHGMIAKGHKECMINTSKYAEGTYLIHINGRHKTSWYRKLLILHNK